MKTRALFAAVSCLLGKTVHDLISDSFADYNSGPAEVGALFTTVLI